MGREGLSDAGGKGAIGALERAFSKRLASLDRECFAHRFFRVKNLLERPLFVSMKDYSIKVQARELKGSRASSRMRKQGLIPAVLYGKGGNRLLSVESAPFQKLWHQAGGSAIVSVEDESGARTTTLIQSVQRDPRRDTFVHIDFYEVQADVKITAMIPVHTDGESYGVKNEGGVLEIVTHEVEVECLPGDLPSEIMIDVTPLKAGEIVHLEDLPALDGVRFLGEPDMPVVAIVEPTVSIAADDEEDEGVAGDAAEETAGAEDGKGEDEEESSGKD